MNLAPTSLALNILPTHDPFYTPQKSLRDEARGMTHADQIITRAGDTAKHRMPQARRRTLQCTHMDMVPRYGKRDCNLCGHVSSLGFLYACRQDKLQAAQALPDEEDVELSFFSDSASLEARALMAEGLGMSKSINKQIREGFYSDEQIEKLFSQRRDVIDTIKDVLEGAMDSGGAHTGANGRGDLPGASRGKPITVMSDPCNIEVCHACKPFLRDRTFADPATVVAEGFKLWSIEDVINLPVRSAAIMKQLELPGERTVRPLPSLPIHDSSSLSLSESDYSHSTSDSMSPYGSSINQSSTTADISKLYDMTAATDSWFRENETPQKDTMMSTPHTVDSVSDSSPYSPLTPLRPIEDTFEASIEKKFGTFGKSASFCGPFRPAGAAIRKKTSWHGRDSTHMTGSIAVTEESVETGVPDIITSSLDDMKL